MGKLGLLCVLVLMSSLAVMGCRKGAPIDNPTATIATSKALSQKQVRAAILAACPQTGWIAREISNDTIEATVNVRNKHQAVVDIVYSPTQYSINYKSSQNLDAQNGSIHPNYNNWVAHLRNNIDLQMAHQANK